MKNQVKQFDTLYTNYIMVHLTIVHCSYVTYVMQHRQGVLNEYEE